MERGGMFFRSILIPFIDEAIIMSIILLRYDQLYRVPLQNGIAQSQIIDNEMAVSHHLN